MNQKKHILGITGGIGAGKSTVLSYLESAHGAHCLKCDETAKTLQKKGGPCYEPMIALFGSDVLRPDGEFDREEISGRVFAQPDLLLQLNAIVHPRVREAVEAFIRSNETDLAVIEAALLLESGYDALCDEIWYIRAPEEVRISRLMADRGYTEEKARSIMRSQQTETYFISHTQLTIDNGGCEADTYQQIDEGLKTHGFLYNSKREQR